MLPLLSERQVHVVLVPLHLSFKRLPEVLDEVPAVKHLLRLWRTFTQATCVLCRPVPGHQFDVRMLLEPRDQRGSCSAAQDFDRLSSL